MEFKGESESEPLTCGICATVLKNTNQRASKNNVRVGEDLDDEDNIETETEVKCEPLSILNMITSVFHYPFSEINGCAKMSQKEVESWLIDQQGQSPFLACENCSETVRDFHCQFLEFRNTIQEASRLSNALKLWGEFIIETGGGAVNLKDIEEAKQLQKRNRRRKRILESGSESNVGLESLDRRVTRSRRYRCAFCQEAFSTQTDLAGHISSLHDNAENGAMLSKSTGENEIKQEIIRAKVVPDEENEPSFGCPHCPKKCINANSLRKHLLSHSTAKLTCPKRGKGFIRSDHLGRHRSNIHGKETLDSGNDDDACTASENELDSTEMNIHSDDNQDDNHFFEVEFGGDAEEPLNPSEIKSSTKAIIELSEKPKESQMHDNPRPSSMQIKTWKPPSQPQCLCLMCNQKFRAIRKLVDHMSSIHRLGKDDKLQLGCAECPKTFSQASTLSRHLRRTHSTAILPCSLCSQVFKRTDALRKHEKNIHGKVRQDNDDESDDNAFTEMGNDVGAKTMGEHNDEGADFNSDDDSEVVFSDQEEGAGISKHPKKAKRYQTFQAPSKPQCRCTACDRKFPTLRNLTTHISSRHRVQIKREANSAHENDERLYGCVQCPKAYAKSRTLYKHIKSHSTLQLLCPTCGKVFNRQERLMRHKRRMHEMGRVKTPPKPRVKKEKLATKEPRHVCSDCGKSFLHKYIFEEHRRIHTGETPFLCAECGKGFRVKGSLDEHIQSDHRLLRFSCSVCGTTFKHKTHLRHHERMQHRGDVEKAFVCAFPECGKAFKLKKHLLNHENIHNPSKAHVCNVCGFSTKWIYNLTQHIRKVHEKQ